MTEFTNDLLHFLSFLFLNLSYKFTDKRTIKNVKTLPY